MEGMDGRLNGGARDDPSDEECGSDSEDEEMKIGRRRQVIGILVSFFWSLYACGDEADGSLGAANGHHDTLPGHRPQCQRYSSRIHTLVYTMAGATLVQSTTRQAMTLLEEVGIAKSADPTNDEEELRVADETTPLLTAPESGPAATVQKEDTSTTHSNGHIVEHSTASANQDASQRS